MPIGILSRSRQMVLRCLSVIFSTVVQSLLYTYELPDVPSDLIESLCHFDPQFPGLGPTHGGDLQGLLIW